MLRYLGAKKKLADAIFEALVGERFGSVVEPFAGSLHLSKEALNKGVADKFIAAEANSNMLNFWNAIKGNPNQFAEDANIILATLPRERMYNRPGRLSPDGVALMRNFEATPVDNEYQLAIRDFVVNAMSDKPRPGMRSLFTPGTYIPKADAVKDSLLKSHELANKLEMFKDWSEVIGKAGDDSLLYVDPPYHGRALYKGGFPLKEQIKLAEAVQKLQGKPKIGMIFNSPKGKEYFDFLDWRDLNPGESVAQFGREIVPI